MKKQYQVIFVDEYDNFTELGIYDDLKKAEPDVNAQLESYNLCEDDEVDPGATPRFGTGDKDNQGELIEYAGTLGPVFDRIIPVDGGCVQVRGFIKEVVDIPALLEDTAKELLDEGYKCDARACASNNEVVKAMESHQAYQKFGMADAYKNAAKLIAHPEILDPQTLLKIMAEAEKENKEND